MKPGSLIRSPPSLSFFASPRVSEFVPKGPGNVFIMRVIVRGVEGGGGG